jgi:hypothetical protein
MKDSIKEALRNKKDSLLLIEERDRKDIIIGAPHHSLGGIKYLPCKEHEDADENTGYIARQIARELNLSSIIACNYRIDPNKKLETDYSRVIIEWEPKYLIEIHGHGAKSADKYLIEISSGNAERTTLSKKFADTLTNKMVKHKSLKRFQASGDFNTIHFKAKKSATITTDKWNPIHIEIPPLLRLTKTNQLPKSSIYFTRLLVDTINEICI